MPSRLRVWSVGRLLLLAAALGATFLLFFGVALRVALRAREVQVPPLVGKTVSEATQSLGALGLTLRVDATRRTDPKVAANRIMQQDPPAGAAARSQRSIRVWLSAGPRTTTVPELIGQTERTARIRLQQDGVDLGSVSEFRSPDYPADAVVSQDPPPAAKAPTVSLLLNRGEEATTYVMPDVIGMDGNRVSDALRERGFRVTITGSQPYPGVPPGTVVRQQPQGGFRVAASDAISLEVSR
ncbi:MAG TPA: PASTA domain-containing protein [Vicinamibacterales bacterium]|jgi:eukaryotic-like serine/threonine-protein kinase|nr:PASTA domain-containing protein [Vicinamibacterales bacterium]